MLLWGPNSFFPLQAISKKQTVQSHSTPEAELVAADFGIRHLGIPCLDIWEKVLGRPIVVELMEDNETAQTVIKSCKNPTMRYMQRTHDLSIKWLHELFHGSMPKGLSKRFSMFNCPTEEQSADIFTKAFTSKDKWLHALFLIGMTGKKRPLPKPRDKLKTSARDDACCPILKAVQSRKGRKYMRWFLST